MMDTNITASATLAGTIGATTTAFVIDPLSWAIIVLLSLIGGLASYFMINHSQDLEQRVNWSRVGMHTFLSIFAAVTVLPLLLNEFPFLDIYGYEIDTRRNMVTLAGLISFTGTSILEIVMSLPKTAKSLISRGR